MRDETYRAHYFRICKVHGASAAGIVAANWLARIHGRPNYFLEKNGRPSWVSGFAKFEDRVAAIGSTYKEGALAARQAA